jgi:hypothetical protein
MQLFTKKERSVTLNMRFWLLIVLTLEHCFALAEQAPISQQFPGTFTIIAKPSVLRPASEGGLYARTQWLLSADGLQRVTQTSNDSDQLERLVLGARGQWESLLPAKITGSVNRGQAKSEAVASLDANRHYAWRYGVNRSIEVWSFDPQSGQGSSLFTLSNDVLGKLQINQVRIQGDAKHGFWLVDIEIGAAWFIEPGSWVVKAVKGLSDDRSPQTSTQQQGDRYAPRTRYFLSAAIGAQGSIWTVDNDKQTLIRRNPQGIELARTQVVWPAPPSRENRQSGLPSYGGPELALSQTGVLVLSETRLQLAALDSQGKLLWQTEVCPTQPTKGCVDTSQHQGKMGLIKTAMGDAQGRVYVDDGVRVFLFQGGGSGRMVAGEPPSCSPQSKLDIQGGAQFTPCVGSRQRIVKLQGDRLLVFANEDTPFAPFELTRNKPESGPGATRLPEGWTARPRLGDLHNLPIVDKLAIASAAHDARLWKSPFDGSAESEARRFASDSRRPQLGIPIEDQVVSREAIIAPRLQSPGALIDQREVALSNLVDGMSARVGSHSVLLKGPEQTANTVAIYNAKTGKLDTNVQVSGLKKAKPCRSEDATSTFGEQYFNDDQHQLYLFRACAGEVYALSPKLEAKLVARTPLILYGAAPSVRPSADSLPKDAPRLSGAITSASRLPDGQLLVVLNQFVFVQKGAYLHPVTSPWTVKQVVAIGPQSALSISASGLALHKWPEKLSEVPVIYEPNRTDLTPAQEIPPGPPCAQPAAAPCGAKN